MADLKGKDFIAVDALSNKDGATVAAPGETCERVDPKSLPWLLEHGHIKQKKEAK